MKKLFFLLIATTGALSAIAQTSNTMQMADTPGIHHKKPYTHDALLKRWVFDVNGLAGMLTQDITVKETMSNYPNALGNFDNGGNIKFSNGMSYGFDAQLGFFWGKKRHFGVGAGFMYLGQTGDIKSSNPFHVEYQATDYQGNTYRQLITSTDVIKESLKITNMNIPVMLKYKVRFSKHFGFTADAGVLINVQEKSAYNSNAAFDYEAIYQYVLNSDNKSVNHTTYDASIPPAAGDQLITKKGYVPSSVYPTLQSYFNAFSSKGYNVGLGVMPNKNTGNVSYTTGSVGFMVQPSINYFFSDAIALNVGGYYLYQPFMQDVKSSYTMSGSKGDYAGMENTVKTNNNQSYGGNLGLRIFFGKEKDTDHDGVPDKKDKCPTVYGKAEFKGCPDTDGDGIADPDDSCVNVPGILKFAGCPDSDGDGIPDRRDACPYAAGPAQYNGCPDRDGDGIIDKEDACPDKAGLAQYKGCPDTDGDGVPDNEDKCPNEAGPASNNGCPVPPPPAPPAPVPPRISTPIQFEVNSTVIHQSSYPIIEEAVRKVNADKDEYIVIDGYTDITGRPAYNKALSMRRAKAVREELIRRGVKSDRIKIYGKGSKDPAESNATPEGRAKNRRAVMHLNMVG